MDGAVEGEWFLVEVVQRHWPGSLADVETIVGSEQERSGDRPTLALRDDLAVDFERHIHRSTGSGRDQFGHDFNSGTLPVGSLSFGFDLRAIDFQQIVFVAKPRRP